ncbi:PREDICTED: uncharacterized protein LOC104798967 [Tarenaya hassleriana]|uniref:uncharacterized protein LOC104798967 n=1 Tax=Tarenaya hassleriana TaxID=28532 RepID=UPI00053C75B5|nr:PREDICTED: uncharacterized protein LOC104798967 [Tarenaya hassleriana]
MGERLIALSIPQIIPKPLHIHRHFHGFSTSTLCLRPNPTRFYRVISQPSRRRTHHLQCRSHSGGNTKTHDDDGIPADEVKIIAKFKSRHNYIRVLEVSRRTLHPLAGSRLLLLDDPGNIHSISFLFKTLTESYFDVFATLPPVIPPGPVGILGFGAGSAARLILELHPEAIVHGWELDPCVIDVARKFFGLSKLEKQYKDRLFINIGNALDASVRTGFSGILVDLFSKGSVIPELQDPNVWENLRSKLRKNGRIMVNVGGRCVEAEDSQRDGDMVMEETLKAMSLVFGDELFVLTLGSGNDSSLALTGDLQDLDAWKKKLRMPELRGYVDMWKPYRDST